MDNKYLTYTLDELLEDKKFIAWVLKGSYENEWAYLLSKNPNLNNKVYKAREIILLLRDTYEVMEENEVLELWKHVEQFDSLHHKRVRGMKIRKAVSWAAIVVSLIMLGGLTYLYLNNQNAEYRFNENTVHSGTKDTKLILYTGEEIKLKEGHSKISITENDELRINNDSVINLQEKIKRGKVPVDMNEIVVPFGKNSELLLVDGTKVWLNAGSKLAFPSKFNEKIRKVHLEGEAYFEVVHKAGQPFIVNTSDLSVEVLGTRFDIAAYPNDKKIQTVLIEGSVLIRKESIFGLGKKEVMLKPNQKADFSKLSKEISVTNEPNADFFIAWKDGWFSFTQQNLKDIFAKLERYYNVKFVFEETTLFDELISGKLDLKDSLEDVMKALADVAQIEYKIKDKQVFIVLEKKKFSE